MLNIKEKCEIDDLVQDWVNDKYLFSAFDVTRQMRARGYECFHQEVKQYVKELMKKIDSTYVRSLVDCVDFTTYVYHPVEVNPVYDPDALKPIFSNYTDEADEADEADEVDETDETDEDSAISLTRDSRGRLYIGSKVLKKLQEDLEEGEYVSVYSDTDGELVVTSDNYAPVDFRTYSVDKDCAIRIGKTICKAAGICAENPVARVDYKAIIITDE